MPNNTQYDAIIAEIITRLDYMEKNNDIQWKKIDKINTRGTATLTGVIFILLGVIVNLVLMLVKG